MPSRVLPGPPSPSEWSWGPVASAAVTKPPDGGGKDQAADRSGKPLPAGHGAVSGSLTEGVTPGRSGREPRKHGKCSGPEYDPGQSAAGAGYGFLLPGEAEIGPGKRPGPDPDSPPVGGAAACTGRAPRARTRWLRADCPLRRRRCRTSRPRLRGVGTVGVDVGRVSHETCLLPAARIRPYIRRPVFRGSFGKPIFAVVETLSHG
jgi:hypothetical protein